MAQSELKRLQAEYGKAAKEHNTRVMERIGQEINAEKAKQAKPKKK